MCGRFSQSKSKQDIKKRFNLKLLPETIEPLFNIAPQRDVLAILNDAPEEMRYAHWGLIPSWSKDIKTPYSMINARCETITEKPTFKRLIKSRRCLIIADSFFEWKKESVKKVPYRIMLKDEGLFAFAGIWDVWEKEGVTITSCSIITTTPNPLVAAIHDRMPVILEPNNERQWLLSDSLDEVLRLLKPYPQEQMTAYPISQLVNSPTNNSKDIFERVA